MAIYYWTSSYSNALNLDVFFYLNGLRDRLSVLTFYWAYRQLKKSDHTYFLNLIVYTFKNYFCSVWEWLEYFFLSEWRIVFLHVYKKSMNHSFYFSISTRINTPNIFWRREHMTGWRAACKSCMTMTDSWLWWQCSVRCPAVHCFHLHRGCNRNEGMDEEPRLRCVSAYSCLLNPQLVVSLCFMHQWSFRFTKIY